MPLPTGTRIGPYEVVAKLGEGGMGEVYRARDTRLSRDVALKVLPEQFASDPERLARFSREAQTLAALNHPNIAQIYGFEAEAGALAMELVEGEDLSATIRRGPLALSDAMPIALQIAGALEAAHEQGIIHRDLKPANVKLRPDGTIKVLDFGLAKALTPDTTTASGDAMNSPTLTARATQMGVILGTAAYMAPEQAKGRPVDRRADIWAFGVVLFEMLTGRRAFEGEDVSTTLAAVLMKDPDWDALPDSTPGVLRRLLQRCLERDPKQRLRDIGEARIALANSSSWSGDDGPMPGPARASRLRAAAIAGAAVLVAAALAAGWFLGSRGAGSSSISGMPFHAEIVPTPAGAFGRNSAYRNFTFTPDGRALIYASTEPAARLLYRRDRDAQAAVPIAGTEGAYGPFVSPDSTAIGFFADGKLKRVPLAGGVAQVIHDMRSPSAPDALGFGWSSEVGPGREAGYGAVWLADDTIIYGRLLGRLWRIPVNGGAPSPITDALAAGEIAHRLPSLLPDGRTVLCTVVRAMLANAGSSVEAIDISTGKRTKLVDDATDGRYAPGGYLLFARAGAIYSVRFDAASLTTFGEPVRIVDDVMHAIGGGAPGRASGVAQYDVSPDGVLAVLRGGVYVTAPRQLLWVSRNGKLEPIALPPAGYLGPRLSADETRIAVWSGTELQIVGVRDGIATPIAKDGLFPVWMPDSSAVLFSRRTAESGQEIYRLPLAGGEPRIVVGGPNPLWASSVSRDSKFLAYVESNPSTGNDIWVVGLAPGEKPVAIATTPASETHPAFSPDGKWLMYVVEEGASSEIYVRPFPGPGRVERITRNGGALPIWASDGKSVFYALILPDRTVQHVYRMSIDTAGNRISVGTPEVFASVPLAYSTPISGFDVNRDGTRLLATIVTPRPAGTSATAATPTLQLTVHANLAGAGRK